MKYIPNAMKFVTQDRSSSLIIICSFSSTSSLFLLLLQHNYLNYMTFFVLAEYEPNKMWSKFDKVTPTYGTW